MGCTLKTRNLSSPTVIRSPTSPMLSWSHCAMEIFFFFSCIYFLATSHEYVADGSRCAIPCCVFRMADKRNCQLYARCHQPARQTGQFSPRRTMRPGEFVVAWPRGHHRQPLSPCRPVTPNGPPNHVVNGDASRSSSGKNWMLQTQLD